MNIKQLFLPVFLSGIFFAACTQEPLFWYIYGEYPPIDPKIGGAPTEIVDTGTALYVANRNSLWKYDYNETKWGSIDKPPGTIKAIAATPNTVPPALYVLIEGGTIHKSTDNGANWDPGTSISGAQQIFGAHDRLFAGNGSAVYEYPSTTPISGAGGLLRGAAWDGTTYYICTVKMWDTENTGIFTVSTTTTATKVYPSSGNASVKGIIAAGSTVIAVNSEGQVIYKDSAASTNSFASPGIINPSSVKFTGGMALWKWTDASSVIHQKILLGLQDGSGTFSYGYRELDLDGSGNVNSSGVFVPGTTTTTNNTARTTSIDPGSKETSAIGKYPVTALYVIPSPPGPNSGDADGRPVIVASTLQDGLWSYRARRGDPQWNGEDNSN
jgi:hypothetical protein